MSGLTTVVRCWEDNKTLCQHATCVWIRTPRMPDGNEAWGRDAYGRMVMKPVFNPDLHGHAVTAAIET